MQLLLTRNVAFGTDVVVIVHPGNTRRITIPSVEEGKVERRKVSADTVGLQPLNIRSPLFQCVPRTRGGPWRPVTTVRWDVLGSFAVWITCEARLELGTDIFWLRLSSQTQSRASEERGPAPAGGERRQARGHHVPDVMEWNARGPPHMGQSWQSALALMYLHELCFKRFLFFFSLPRSLKARKSWLLRQTWWHRASASR